jgi:hypothetical protein
VLLPPYYSPNLEAKAGGAPYHVRITRLSCAREFNFVPLVLPREGAQVEPDLAQDDQEALHTGHGSVKACENAFRWFDFWVHSKKLQPKCCQYPASCPSMHTKLVKLYKINYLTVRMP